MKRFISIFLVAMLTLSITGKLAAIDFEEELRRLAEENAKGYIQPFATAFGVNMNSGLYHSAKAHNFPFPNPIKPIPGFDVGVKFAIVTIPDEDLTYDFLLPAVPLDVSGIGEVLIDVNDLYPDRSSPTVFGKGDPPALQPTPGAERDSVLVRALRLAGKSDSDIDLMRSSGAFGSLMTELIARLDTINTVPGLDLTSFPLVVPQVSVGLPFSSEVMLRYVPEFDAGDIAGISLFGFGLKHEVSNWIPLCPVAISVQIVYQTFKVGEVLEATNTAMNLHASKTLGMGISVTPYVGFGVESSTLTIDYEIKGSTIPELNGKRVLLDVDGENKVRFTGGVRVALTLLSINADYSIGKYNSASVGIAFSLF